MDIRKLNYIAHTQVGFEHIVAEQLRQEFDGVKVTGTRTISDKNGMVMFTYDGDVQDLLQLRTIEDLFVQVLLRNDIPPVYAGLKMLTSSITNLPIEEAFALARTLTPGRGGRGKVRYRVVSRLAAEASYRRIDLQEAVEKAMRARKDHKWEHADEHALEFWVTALPDEIFLALRVTDAKMRRHDEKRAQIPASLRPSAAAALIWLSRPRPTDIFLDPMCGAGTLLIERGEAGRYKQLYAGDIRAEAVEATLINIGSRYQPVTVQEWDAQHMPLEDGSVTNVAVNLPFGRQIGSLEDNRSLYPGFLRELARVMRPAGRFVAMTGDMRNFERSLDRNKEFTPLQSYDVMILGRGARVYVIERK